MKIQKEDLVEYTDHNDYYSSLSSEQPTWRCINVVADVERHSLCMNKVMGVAARSWCLLQREVSLSLKMLSLF